jgi:hypothetical protein
MALIVMMQRRAGWHRKARPSVMPLLVVATSAHILGGLIPV